MSKLNLTTLRQFCLIGFLVFIHFKILSQPSDYDIESFQGVYNELSSYQSVALLTEGSIFWEYEFDLNFDFPFFDSFYTKLIYREEAWGSLTEDQDEALLLMEFDAYVFDNVIDTSNITSDVRFAHVNVSGAQAFVLQYTNVRFFADPYAETHDTYFNFQLWFYENGVMEVHFGDIQLDDNPIYSPGIGFWCYDNEGIDTTGRCGPHMGIANPLDESIAIGLEGAHNDFEIIEDNYATLTVIPPQGWIIRFIPESVGTSEPYTFKPLLINPNPSIDFIKIPFAFANVFVIDAMGKIVFDGVTQNSILDISSFPVGLYYLKLTIDDTVYAGKFVKI